MHIMDVAQKIVKKLRVELRMDILIFFPAAISFQVFCHRK